MTTKTIDKLYVIDYNRYVVNGYCDDEARTFQVGIGEETHPTFESAKIALLTRINEELSWLKSQKSYIETLTEEETHDELWNDDPWWLKDIEDFDGLEVCPVRDLAWDDEKMGERPFTTSHDCETRCEPCAPQEAHFWSVYAHLKTGGLFCLEDFPTQEQAKAYAENIFEQYEQFEIYGILS